MNARTDYCSAFNPDFSETVAYNNPLFPAYVRYGFLSAYPDYAAVSHWHPDLEFILIKKGAMTYNVNGQWINLTENNGIMVNSRQIHHGFSPEHHECAFICILLSPQLLQGNEWFYQNCIGHITENAALPYLYLDSSGWQSAILKRLDRIYRSFGDGSEGTPENPLSYFELMEDFVFIMKTLCANLPVRQQAPQKETAELAALKDMITYVEEHFAQRMTLADIASAGACCKSRCSLLFKKYLRDTPVSYTAKLRLRKSLSALLEGDSSVTEIAYEYGFGGASYYCETFRKYYGMSPMQYKKISGR